MDVHEEGWRMDKDQRERRKKKEIKGEADVETLVPPSLPLATPLIRRLAVGFILSYIPLN